MGWIRGRERGRGMFLWIRSDFECGLSSDMQLFGGVCGGLGFGSLGCFVHFHA